MYLWSCFGDVWNRRGSAPGAPACLVVFLHSAPGAGHEFGGADPTHRAVSVNCLCATGFCFLENGLVADSGCFRGGHRWGDAGEEAETPPDAAGFCGDFVCFGRLASTECLVAMKDGEFEWSTCTVTFCRDWMMAPTRWKTRCRWQKRPSPMESPMSSPRRTPARDTGSTSRTSANFGMICRAAWGTG